MKTAYETLVKINFGHSYFSDGIFSGFQVNVADATLKLIYNRGFIMKTFKGGLCILFDQLFAGKTTTREELLAENLSFEFTLTLKDPLFYNYTENLPVDISQSIYYFRNALDTPPGLLHSGEVVSEKDIFKLWYFKERFFVKPFAKLDLTMAPGSNEEYDIRFRARSTQLRYILVSNYLQGLKNPAVINSDNAGTFCEPTDITLPDKRVVSSFALSDPFILNQLPGKGITFQLVENYEKESAKYKVVIRALPFPDITAVSLLPKPNINTSIHISDIFI
jgi:hypothetical protein